MNINELICVIEDQLRKKCRGHANVLSLSMFVCLDCESRSYAESIYSGQQYKNVKGTCILTPNKPLI